MSELLSELPMRVFDTPDDVGLHVAKQVLIGASQAQAEGRAYVLGAPGGRSLRPTYQALAHLAAAENTDLSHVTIVMMDEYLEAGNSRDQCVPPAAGYSCRGFGQRVILRPLRNAVGPGRAPSDAAIWLPNPDDPGAFDHKLREAGGIDLFLIASGSFDGHVAFNAPGTAMASVSRIVELPSALVNDSNRRFMRTDSVEDHPTHGVTIGLATIASLSKAALLVCTGREKQNTVRRILAAGGFTPDWPATMIFECRAPQLLVDAEAAP